jgi:hypothetical protein
MGIADHQLWHEGHFGQKVGHARDQTTGHHRGTKANMGKGWSQDIANHRLSAIMVEGQYGQRLVHCGSPVNMAQRPIL